MTPEELVREGRLSEALAALQARVRAQPADPKLRIFLFQLLAALGDWQRARTQLNVVAEMDPSTLAMKATYTDALQCEALRQEIFHGARSPLIFGEPERWVALLIEALGASAAGQYERFQRLLDESLEQAPETSGTINGEPFEWIADGDTRLGPVLEVIVNARYFWIPFARIKRIVIEAPTDLRDAIWTPASFVWANDGEAVGLIPTRYVGSEQADDAKLALGRSTVWQEPAENVFLGLGQRVLMTDSSEYGLMDVREIVLNTSTQQA